MHSYTIPRSETGIPSDELEARVTQFLAVNGITIGSIALTATQLLITCDPDPHEALARYVSTPVSAEVNPGGGMVDLGTDAVTPTPMAGGTGVRGWLSTISSRVLAVWNSIEAIRTMLQSGINENGAMRTVVEEMPDNIITFPDQMNVTQRGAPWLVGVTGPVQVPFPTTQQVSVTGPVNVPFPTTQQVSVTGSVQVPFPGTQQVSVTGPVAVTVSNLLNPHPVVLPDEPTGISKSFTTTGGAKTTIWTPATGKKWVLRGFNVTVGGVGGTFKLYDGNATDPFYTSQTLALGGTVSFQFVDPIPSSAANNALRIEGSGLLMTANGSVWGKEV